MSLDSTVSTATVQRLVGQGWKSVRSKFCPVIRVETGSGTHIVSYSIDSRVPFPAVKLTGREDGHAPPSGAEVKSIGTIAPLPHMFEWHGS
jgi:hypothetical protein